jgi:hypothetical protein
MIKLLQQTGTLHRMKSAFSIAGRIGAESLHEILQLAGKLSIEMKNAINNVWITQ